MFVEVRWTDSLPHDWLVKSSDGRCFAVNATLELSARAYSPLYYAQAEEASPAITRSVLRQMNASAIFAKERGDAFDAIEAQSREIKRLDEISARAANNRDIRDVF